MGRRSEPRISVSYPVVVRGFDLQGRRFSVNVVTRDISGSGASLEGINHLVQAGKKIEIECDGKSAWYTVEWIGKNGSARAGAAGVRCLERKYIWNLPPKPPETDTYDHEAPPQTTRSSLSGRPERRRYPRRPCRVEAEVWTSDSSGRMPGKVTDVSLGGCYVEMLAPLPIDTAVELAIDLEGQKLHAAGKIRSSQTGFGMGVAFTAMSPENYELLRKFAPREGPARVAPEPATLALGDSPLKPGRQQISPSATTRVDSAVKSNEHASALEIQRALEALIRALLRKGVLSREDLAEELEKVQAARP